ncbi:hypothetical protein [Oceanobacillus iheyensis]|uniref:hypothetical protein n=1 Tax=Oceanobacillus iheyensis TaxID=182710 RepID=UPI0012603096
MNNTIKVIKRNSYGIKGFERLKKKILWQQGNEKGDGLIQPTTTFDIEPKYFSHKRIKAI